MDRFSNRTGTAISEDEKYMLRCIEIAKNGLGSTAPNPSVGAVIVYDNAIIGEGFTSAYGGAHAEVNAIHSVKDKGLLSKSTLYVTLEPCSHFGKTPPCANLIVEKKIPKVVIGLKDPHEKVAGKGIDLLKESGCEVVLGVLKERCREHHKRFLTFHEKKRPYVVLKWAQTKDGYIAPEKDLRDSDPSPYWITNSYSRQMVHKWRGEEQAILIGTNTALEDNPKLDTRLWSGTPPIRIVWDRNLRIPNNFHVFNGIQPSIIFYSSVNSSKKLKNVDLKRVESFKNIVLETTKLLYEHSILSILVEGGAKTIQSFIDANVWDEARIFTGKNTFVKGVKAPSIMGKVVQQKWVDKDELKIIVND